MSSPRSSAWATCLSGASPLDPDEAEGLLPSHISTQGALNAWEQLNIARADRWAIARRRRRAAAVLTPDFAVALHRRMFDQTWSWAGRYRSTDKSIGGPASQVRVALRDRLLDVLYWRAGHIYTLDEIAARFHYQLVLVHPWPNGNGRWARLMADVLLHAEGRPRFSWGSADLERASSARTTYLAALRAADHGDFSRLLTFVRG